MLKDTIATLVSQYFSNEFNVVLKSEDLQVVILDAEKLIKITSNFPFIDHDVKINEILKSSIPHDYKIEFSHHILAHKNHNLVQGKSNIKNIVAIASAKGGVGKSTLTLNIAYAMQKLGANVGILDADIHGPSQPTMLGITKADIEGRDHGLNPVIKNGIQSASISYFMTKDDPVVWRGPMVSRALEQMVHDIKWQNLDYLFIDMPPGTGDLPLTLVKKLPLTAAVIVTTPQDIACIDAKKSAQMFQKTNIPLLGTIENMSGFQCSSCGSVTDIFGVGGGKSLADSENMNLLAKVPLHIDIRTCADQGVPLADNNTELAEIYKNISFQIALQLSLRERDFVRNS